MKITYHVDKIDGLFKKHTPKDTIKEADKLRFEDHHCFVYVDDVFVFSYPHDEMWLSYWRRRPNSHYRDNMHELFKRWVRLKVRQLRRPGGLQAPTQSTF
jgi:hypothetical protein